MKKIFLIFFVFLLFSLPCWAKENIKDAINSRTEFTYIQDDLYKIYTTLDKLTEIRLQPGETPVYMGGGDSTAWNVEVVETTNEDGSTQASIFLKSIVDYKFVSNIVISTDRRMYRIMLCAIPSGKYNTIISWKYPMDEAIIQQKVMQEIEEEISVIPTDWDKLNKNYSIDSKNYPWCPTEVFDDGKKIYIKLSPDAASYSLPVVFLKKDNELQLVNYRFKSGYFIVDQLCEELQLVDGNDIVKIKKTNQKKKTIKRTLHHSCGRELFQ